MIRGFTARMKARLDQATRRENDLKLEKLRWHVALLRAVTPEDIRRRAQAQLLKARWRRGGPKLASLPALPDIQRVARMAFFGLPLERESLYITVDAAEIESVLEEADAHLAGQWRFFAFTDSGAQ